MKCKRCGSEVENGMKFCINCGYRLDSSMDNNGRNYGQNTKMYAPGSFNSNFDENEETALLNEDDAYHSIPETLNQDRSQFYGSNYNNSPNYSNPNYSNLNNSNKNFNNQNFNNQNYNKTAIRDDDYNREVIIDRSNFNYGANRLNQRPINQKTINSKKKNRLPLIIGLISALILILAVAYFGYAKFGKYLILENQADKLAMEGKKQEAVDIYSNILSHRYSDKVNEKKNVLTDIIEKESIVHDIQVSHDISIDTYSKLVSVAIGNSDLSKEAKVKVAELRKKITEQANTLSKKSYKEAIAYLKPYSEVDTEYTEYIKLIEKYDEAIKLAEKKAADDKKAAEKKAREDAAKPAIIKLYDTYYNNFPKAISQGKINMIESAMVKDSQIYKTQDAYIKEQSKAKMKLDTIDHKIESYTFNDDLSEGVFVASESYKVNYPGKTPADNKYKVKYGFKKTGSDYKLTSIELIKP